MNDEKLLRLALEAIERGVRDGYWNKDTVDVSAAIQKRLLQNSPTAAPVQEPVAWMSASRFEELQKGFTVMTTLTKQRAFEDDVAIHTTPPAAQRQWVGLTDEEIKHMLELFVIPPHHVEMVVQAIETKLKEKNT